MIKKIIISLAILTAATLSALPVMAATSEQSVCEGSGGTWNGSSCSDSGPSLMGTIGAITNILLYILGAIAVIMIIVGGIRYATSGGDQNSVTGAKNTILYAIIGLVVAVLAYAIVNFVIARIK